jgi:hypothetical protein
MKKSLILLFTISIIPFVACDRDDEILPLIPRENVTSPANTSQQYKPVIITSFYPELVKGGAEVAIFGENFGQRITDHYITINGWELEILNIPREGMVMIRVPLHLPPGDYPISLHTNGQTGTSATPLKIIGPILNKP